MSPFPPGKRLPTPGGDAPGLVPRAMTREGICATTGHMPSSLSTVVGEARCLCGAKGYRRVRPAA